MKYVSRVGNGFCELQERYLREIRIQVGSIALGLVKKFLRSQLKSWSDNLIVCFAIDSISIGPSSLSWYGDRVRSSTLDGSS